MDVFDKVTLFGKSKLFSAGLAFDFVDSLGGKVSGEEGVEGVVEGVVVVGGIEVDAVEGFYLFSRFVVTFSTFKTDNVLP